MGMHENKYYYWQRRLREAAISQIEGKKEAPGNMIVPQGFTEVKIADASGQEASGDEIGEIRIETGGVKITAGSAYPISKLAMIVRELTQP